MDRVNSLILSRAESHVDLVPKLARYLIESGGKRLRPMLTIACASMFAKDNKSSNNAIHFAAAVEFMHNATLLHDDVVDESEMRRGKPAARMIWGNQASVLVGDFLLGQAFLMMVETRDLDALNILSRAAAVMAEGEVFQLSKTSDLSTTAKEYDLVIRSKTAAMFEVATKIGAMAGGANDKECNALALYGIELGRAFQLIDDALDYGGINSVFGKMTLPVILALKNSSETEKALIISALGNQNLDDKILKQIIALFQEKDVIEQTVSEAKKCVVDAKQALKTLPKSDITNLLADIADYCLLRAY
jgi:octaprenyl-diphosphate synthase